MKTKHKIKLIEIAANCAGTLSTGGKRLADIQAVYDALLGIVNPPSASRTIAGHPAALITIYDLDLGVREFNVLKANNIATLGQLALKTPSEVSNWRGCGAKICKSLREILWNNGLDFNMIAEPVKYPAMHAGQRVRYKLGKSLWATGEIRSIESDFVRLDYDIDGGHTLLFRDYGKKWEVVL